MANHRADKAEGTWADGLQALIPTPRAPDDRGGCPEVDLLFQYETGQDLGLARRGLRIHLLGCASCQEELRCLHEAPQRLYDRAPGTQRSTEGVWAWIAALGEKVLQALPIPAPLGELAAVRGSGASPETEIRGAVVPRMAYYQAGAHQVAVSFKSDPGIPFWDVSIELMSDEIGLVQMMQGAALVEERALKGVTRIRDLEPGCYTLHVGLGAEHYAILLPPLP